MLEYRTEIDFDWKVTQFNYMYRTIRTALKVETRTTSQTKLYEAMAAAFYAGLKHALRDENGGNSVRVAGYTCRDYQGNTIT
jgi:hypothetical protein